MPTSAEGVVIFSPPTRAGKNVKPTKSQAPEVGSPCPVASGDIYRATKYNVTDLGPMIGDLFGKVQLVKKALQKSPLDRHFSAGWCNHSVCYIRPHDK